MDYKTRQEQEIATIAPRTFKLELSDADVNRLFEKAGSVGLTPENLLENFIGDLVDGTYTNGSDERMYAENWFDRCIFSFDEYDTFLAYLIKNYEDRNFFDLLDTLNDCKLELDDLDPEDFDSDEAYTEEQEYFNAQIEEAEEEIQAIFNDYLDCSGNTESYEKELEIIVRYRENLEKSLSERFLKERRVQNG